MLRIFVTLLSSLLFVGTSSALTVSTFYIDSVAYQRCGYGTTFCSVNFARTPNKNIHFQVIACFIETTAPLVFIEFGVKGTASGATLRKTYVPVPTPVIYQGTYKYTVNQPVSMVYGPLRYPVVQLAATVANDMALECTTSGEAINAS